MRSLRAILLVALAAAAAEAMGTPQAPAFCPMVVPAIKQKLALSHRSGSTTVSRVSFPEALRIQSDELSELVAQFYSTYHSKLERSRRTLEATWARQKEALKADLARIDRLLGEQRQELEEEWNQTFSRLMSLKPASVFRGRVAAKRGPRRSKGEDALYSSIARSVSPHSLPPRKP